jgi:hypothetical protein
MYILLINCIFSDPLKLGILHYEFNKDCSAVNKRLYTARNTTNEHVLAPNKFDFDVLRPRDTRYSNFLGRCFCCKRRPTEFVREGCPPHHGLCSDCAWKTPVCSDCDRASARIFRLLPQEGCEIKIYFLAFPIKIIILSSSTRCRRFSAFASVPRGGYAIFAQQSRL